MTRVGARMRSYDVMRDLAWPAVDWQILTKNSRRGPFFEVAFNLWPKP